MFTYYELESVEVVLLDVEQELSVERLLSRGREDDTESAIKHRLQQYHAQTEPVIDYFNNHRRYTMHRIDGGQHIEKVTKDIFEAIKLTH